MGLAAEGPVAVRVLLDELIDDGAGRAFIETLPNKHLDDERPKGFQRIVAPLRHHARNRHEQRRAGYIVASGPLGLSIGITQLLLSLALFAVADLLGLCWHGPLPRQVSGYRCQTVVTAATPFAWNRKSRFMNRFFGVLNQMFAI